MQAYIRVKYGSYRNEEIRNEVFPMLKQYQHGAKGGFVTVDGSHKFGPEKTKIRITVNHISDYEFVDEDDYAAQAGVTIIEREVGKIVSNETDEEVMARIAERFDILHQMTRAACEGNIRAMIVTGPPGVGKSFGVEAELERASVFDRIKGKKLRSNVIKGAATPIGLYKALYEYSDKDNVLVFDDCDMLFYDDLSLNLLKSALDTGKNRKICWNSESRTLKAEEIPNSFNFKGSVIFITNLKFENIKSKKLQDHLSALESRCHYLDLTLDTTRDKLLRIKQIANTGELFDGYDFTPEQQADVIDFLFANHHKLREVSLRTALKLGDLYKSFPNNWQSMARTTVMKNAA